MTARPVVLLSLAINYWIGEIDATGYHVVNVAIHLLAGLTLFGILRRMLTQRFGGSADWLAFAVALLWLVHPLQTQSVTYIIQRSESLMGLFYHVAQRSGARRCDAATGAAIGVRRVAFRDHVETGPELYRR